MDVCEGKNTHTHFQLVEDMHPSRATRAIGVSHTSCKYEFDGLVDLTAVPCTSSSLHLFSFFIKINR